MILLFALVLFKESQCPYMFSIHLPHFVPFCLFCDDLSQKPAALYLNNETHNYHIIIVGKMALTEIISRI